MQDNLNDCLSEQELSEVSGGFNTPTMTEPKYSIGTMLKVRSDPSRCFGRVIRRKYFNGQWMYTIMGSSETPQIYAENSLQPA